MAGADRDGKADDEAVEDEPAGPGSLTALLNAPPDPPAANARAIDGKEDFGRGECKENVKAGGLDSGFICYSCLAQWSLRGKRVEIMTDSKWAIGMLSQGWKINVKANEPLILALRVSAPPRLVFFVWRAWSNNKCFLVVSFACSRARAGPGSAQERLCAQELEHGASVRFTWVKGHAGHDGNEAADALANQVASRSCVPNCGAALRCAALRCVSQCCALHCLCVVSCCARA